MKSCPYCKQTLPHNFEAIKKAAYLKKIREAFRTRQDQGLHVGRPNKLSEKEIGIVIHLSSNGRSLRKIAKQFNVSFSTIRRYLKASAEVSGVKE